MRLLLSILAVASAASAADAPLLLQKPTLSKTHIVFAYAGDLWTVVRDGGDAVRLTSGTGIETDPVFSPDGTKVAFTGEYDGNVDVFVVPASGGVPKRLTWHPAPDRVLGWTPDGTHIIFGPQLDAQGIEQGVDARLAGAVAGEQRQAVIGCQA